MRIFRVQNVKQIFAYLWLENEMDDVPADHSKNKPLEESFQTQNI